METTIGGGEGRKETGAAPPGVRGPGVDGQFFTTVNGVTVKLAEPMARGEHILDRAGLVPAADYALIQVLRHGTRLIGLGETVDLQAEATEVFRAFRTDRVFLFTLNGQSYEWGAEKIPEPELRSIGHVSQDEVLVLDRDGTDIDLTPTDVVDLGHHGTAHLHTEKRLVTVFFENKPVEIPRGTYTTEQLKKLFNVQEGYVLEYINEEGQLTPLKPGAKLRVREGMKFFEQVPCGGSS